ncbi:MAG: winged helix DNA-binding domain-containing protein [Chloroflexi bacterium]|nr:MAG: winged helix DNA-binding domain-containing protein [Chloroflexota bacterium]
MTLDIVGYRLYSQFLSQTKCTHPDEVVERLGAVQAQDYAGAKWGLGQRLKSATDTTLDQSFNEGKLLRTHVMRPTWHFVTPADIRWILALTAPRVHAVNAFMYRKLELDRAAIKKSYAVLEKVLQGNKQLTRSELASVFEKAGINAEGLRLGYFMMSAELDGVICSGARRGKQMTYALLEERAPQAVALTHEEALAELTRRYFATRGPATLQDFTWWSGLTMADAKNGIELVKSQFENELIDGKAYWFPNSVSPAREKSPTAHLLPNYDEYFIGFKDRSAIGELAKRAGIKGDDPSFLAHIIILDGQVVGGWRRTLKRDAVLIELNLITELTKTENQAVSAATDQYARFLGLPAQLANAD